MNPNANREVRISNQRRVRPIVTIAVSVGLLTLLLVGLRALQLRPLQPTTPLGDFAFLEGRSPLHCSPSIAVAGDCLYTFRTDYALLVSRAERELTAAGWERHKRPDWPYGATYSKGELLLVITRSRAFLRANRHPDESLVYELLSPEEPGLPDTSPTSETARGWVTVQGIWTAHLRPVPMFSRN